MDFFDFHHHKKGSFGIYNLGINEAPPEKTFFSAGIHAQDISENFSADFAKIEKLVVLPNCLAVGECGLDALVNIPENKQSEVFKKHILLANAVRKPVIVHCVRRFAETLKFKKITETPLIIHGFHKKDTVADELLRAGFLLSFGSALLRSLSLQEIFRKIPPEKFFLETDDADVSIEEIYRVAALLKATAPENIAGQITENIENLRT